MRTSQMSDLAFAAFVAAHPVSGGKGDEIIQQQEAQQAGFNKQLASIFQTAFGKQSSIFNFLTQKLTNQVNNPEGFTPEQKAALETSNIEGASKAYAHAQQATQGAIAARGGSTLPSGVTAQLTAENANAGAAQLAGGENQIALADAERKQDNTWRALNGLDQVAGEQNPGGYAGLYNGGSGNVGNLGTAYNSTQQSPVWGVLGGITGGIAGGIGKKIGG